MSTNSTAKGRSSPAKGQVRHPRPNVHLKSRRFCLSIRRRLSAGGAGYNQPTNPVYPIFVLFPPSSISHLLASVSSIHLLSFFRHLSFFCLLFCVLCSLCVCCFAFIVRLLFRVYCASVAVSWPLRVLRFLLGFYGLSRCFPPLVSCLSFVVFPLFCYLGS